MYVSFLCLFLVFQRQAGKLAIMLQHSSHFTAVLKQYVIVRHFICHLHSCLQTAVAFWEISWWLFFFFFPVSSRCEVTTTLLAPLWQWKHIIIIELDVYSLLGKRLAPGLALFLCKATLSCQLFFRRGLKNEDIKHSAGIQLHSTLASSQTGPEKPVFSYFSLDKSRTMGGYW